MEEDMVKPKICFYLWEAEKVSWYVFPDEQQEFPEEQGGNTNSMESSSSSKRKRLESSYVPPIPPSLSPPASASIADLFTFPSPSPSQLLHYPTFATVGSTIYGFGGQLEICGDPIPDVYAYYPNSSSLDQGWFPLPKMMGGRNRPLTAVMDKKLYVFGSWDNRSPRPWAEVFDTVSQQWRSLPEFQVTDVPVITPTVALVWDEQKSIVLVDDTFRTLAQYDTKDNIWKFLDYIAQGVDFNSRQGAVLVDGIIYYCVGNHLYAYHIIGGAGIHTTIHGIPTYKFLKYASLIHLGGELFCMVWFDDCKRIIHYARFCASISPEGILTANVVSSQSYPVVGLDPHFGGAFLLSGVASEPEPRD